VLAQSFYRLDALSVAEATAPKHLDLDRDPDCHQNPITWSLGQVALQQKIS